jgi:hypothetical protein
MTKVMIAVASGMLAVAAPAKIATMDAAAETAMALSAAPEALRAGAGVYVLGEDGFGQVRASTNGFTCIVEREGDGTIAPTCFDPEGSETTLNAVLMRGRLIQSGMSVAEVRAAMKAAYARGELIAPRKPGVAYMLSTEFKGPNRKTGAIECVFPPHVMFYAPYMKNADYGIPRSAFGSTKQPWILNEGEPDAYFIVADHSAHHAC